MTIYLVRHGQAVSGVDDLDPGLAEVGHLQATAAAAWLAAANPGRLIVSPLKRTRETAEPISSLTGLLPELREEVAEVFAPEMPAEQRKAMIGPFMAGVWSDQPAELREWRKRVVDCVLELGLDAASRDHDLVVVSHYIAIGVIIGEASADDRVVPVPMANCSITSVDVGHGGFTLRAACATTHLAPELITGVGEARLRGA